MDFPVSFSVEFLIFKTFRLLWNMLLPLPELPERRAYGQKWNTLRAPRMGAPLRSSPDYAWWLEGSQQHRREHMQWRCRSFLLPLLRFNSDRQWVGLSSGKAVNAVIGLLISQVPCRRNVSFTYWLPKIPSCWQLSIVSFRHKLSKELCVFFCFIRVFSKRFGAIFVFDP